MIFEFIKETGIKSAVISVIGIVVLTIYYYIKEAINPTINVREEYVPPVIIPPPKPKLLSLARTKYPTKLTEYIGHTKVVNRLSKLLHNYKFNDRVIGHVLLSGQGGLGKTTLAEILANEVGQGYVSVIGERLKEIRNVEKLITPLEEASILFVDEIHNSETNVLEFLYDILQDFKSVTGATVKEFPRFTFIGATTDPYKLTEPLRQRIPNKFTLSHYTEEEIVKIISYCLDPEIESITQPAKEIIARTCQGVVRIARDELLRSCVDEAIYSGSSIIDNGIVLAVLEDKDINPVTGLTKQQISVLKTLSTGNTMGLRNLAHSIGVSDKELELLIEPYILRKGYVQRTPRGRVITDIGKKVLHV